MPVRPPRHPTNPRPRGPLALPLALFPPGLPGPGPAAAPPPKPHRPAPRGVASAHAAWPRSPVDRFVRAKLLEKGMGPAPAADRRTLLRRVTFDLIGLPPTPAEIDAFLADPSPYAYAKVVDRLLASPHYGERWARHWMDVIHFAETHG